MKQLKSELIDFREWSRKNCTSALFNGIELAIENYTKSFNSQASTETRNVIDNKQEKNICDCYMYRWEVRSDGKRYCVNCGTCKTKQID